MQNLQLVGSQTIAEAAVEYKKLSGQIKELEDRKRELSAILLPQAKLEKKIIIDYHGIDISVVYVESARESFDLKEARLRLPAEVIAPYIKVSTSEYVRVS